LVSNFGFLDEELIVTGESIRVFICLFFAFFACFPFLANFELMFELLDTF
jgi:hypothetical protein